MGTGSLPGVKCGRGVLLTTHPLLVPQSWKSTSTHPLGHTGPVTGLLYLRVMLCIGINVCVVSVCAGRRKVVMVVESEILVRWVVTHTTAKVVTLDSEEWPIFIFGVGW